MDRGTWQATVHGSQELDTTQQLNHHHHIDREISFFLSFCFLTTSATWEAQKVLVAQLCLTLCDPIDCSLPGSSVYGIFQVRMLG